MASLPQVIRRYHRLASLRALQRCSPLIEERCMRTGCREIIECEVCACFLECCSGECPSSNANADCANSLCGGDILGRVSNHDDATLAQRDAELLGSPLGAATDQLNPVLVIAAEASESETVVEVHP